MGSRLNISISFVVCRITKLCGTTSKMKDVKTNQKRLHFCANCIFITVLRLQTTAKMFEKGELNLYYWDQKSNIPCSPCSKDECINRKLCSIGCQQFEMSNNLKGHLPCAWNEKSVIPSHTTLTAKYKCKKLYCNENDLFEDSNSLKLVEVAFILLFNVMAIPERVREGNRVRRSNCTESMLADSIKVYSRASLQLTGKLHFAFSHCSRPTRHCKIGLF